MSCVFCGSFPRCAIMQSRIEVWDQRVGAELFREEFCGEWRAGTPAATPLVEARRGGAPPQTPRSTPWPRPRSCHWPLPGLFGLNALSPRPRWPKAAQDRWNQSKGIKAGWRPSRAPSALRPGRAAGRGQAPALAPPRSRFPARNIDGGNQDLPRYLHHHIGRLPRKKCREKLVIMYSLEDE